MPRAAKFLWMVSFKYGSFVVSFGPLCPAASLLWMLHVREIVPLILFGNPLIDGVSSYLYYKAPGPGKQLMMKGTGCSVAFPEGFTTVAAV